MRILLRKLRFKFSFWIDEIELWIKTWHGELTCFEVELTDFRIVMERLGQKNIVLVQSRIKGDKYLFWVLGKHEERVKKLVNEF